MNIFSKVWVLFTAKQRKTIAVLLAATLFNSVLEFFGIGLVMPIVLLISNPDSLYKYPKAVEAMSHLNIANPSQALGLILGVFITVFIFKNVYIVKLSQWQLRFTSSMLCDLSGRLLRTYLFSPWSFHLQKNTAQLLNNTIGHVGSLCNGLIVSVFALFTESCVVFSIIILLLIVDPVSVLIGLIFLGGASALLLYLTHKRIVYLGRDNQTLSTEMIKSVNEALGGIKETKILGREEYFINNFIDKNRRFTRSAVQVALINVIQRSSIEVMFIGVVAAMSAMILMQGHNGAGLVSRMALFIVASFRLMPSIHRINASISSIKYYQPFLELVYDDVHKLSTGARITFTNKAAAEEKEMPFDREIRLVDLYFRYPNTQKDVLTGVNISIPKGRSVGFIGRSGAGKTTAVDIILGLLKPTAGRVMVDDHDINDDPEAWRKHLGYIPQAIYLSDSTIRRNIAFGIDDGEIDDEKVWRALADAQLYDFVKEMPQGLNTLVGERGMRISGGQRQRIGIARAIYHNPDVLVMDEATSSLDTKTENEIARSIFLLSGSKTLIIIAHRATTVEKCDIIYEFSGGKAGPATKGPIVKQDVASLGKKHDEPA